MPPRRRNTRSSRQDEELIVAETMAGLASSMGCTAQAESSDGALHPKQLLTVSNPQEASSLPSMVASETDDQDHPPTMTNSNPPSIKRRSSSGVELQGLEPQGTQRRRKKHLKLDPTHPATEAGSDRNCFSLPSTPMQSSAKIQLSLNPLRHVLSSGMLNKAMENVISCAGSTMEKLGNSDIPVQEGRSIYVVGGKPVTGNPPTPMPTLSFANLVPQLQSIPAATFTTSASEKPVENAAVLKLPIVLAPVLLPNGTLQLVPICMNGVSIVPGISNLSVATQSPAPIFPTAAVSSSSANNHINGLVGCHDNPADTFDASNSPAISQHLPGSLSTLRSYYGTADPGAVDTMSPVTMPTVKKTLTGKNNTRRGKKHKLSPNKFSEVAVDQSEPDNAMERSNQEACGIDSTYEVTKCSMTVPGSLSTLRDYYSHQDKLLSPRGKPSSHNGVISAKTPAGSAANSSSSIADASLRCTSASSSSSAAAGSNSGISLNGSSLLCEHDSDGKLVIRTLGDGVDHLVNSTPCTRVLPEISRKQPSIDSRSVSTPRVQDVGKAVVAETVTVANGDRPKAARDLDESAERPRKRQKLETESESEGTQDGTVVSEAGATSDSQAAEDNNFSSSEGLPADNSSADELMMQDASGSKLPFFVHLLNAGEFEAGAAEQTSTVDERTESIVVDARNHPVLRPDEDGDLPLHVAVVQGNVSLVGRLLETMSQLDVPVDCYNNARQTPLHLAVITNNVDLVLLLLEAGASPNCPDRSGQNSLHLAVANNHSDCLQLLLTMSKVAVDPNAKNYEGLTPLHLAVKHNWSSLAELLITMGASIDAVDGKSGHTPLYLAAEANRLEIAELLLERNADVQLSSYYGCTPMHAAAARAHLAMVKLLAKYGAVEPAVCVEKVKSESRETPKSKVRTTRIERRPSFKT